MDRLKLGVIFGGSSEEQTISAKSALEFAKHLDTEKYEPFYIGITKSGAWKLCDGPGANWENGGCRSAVLSPDRSLPGLLVLEQGRYIPVIEINSCQGFGLGQLLLASRRTVS